MSIEAKLNLLLHGQALIMNGLLSGNGKAFREEVKLWRTNARALPLDDDLALRNQLAIMCGITHVPGVSQNTSGLATQINKTRKELGK